MEFVAICDRVAYRRDSLEALARRAGWECHRRRDSNYRGQVSVYGRFRQPDGVRPGDRPSASRAAVINQFRQRPALSQIVRKLF